METQIDTPFSMHGATNGHTLHGFLAWSHKWTHFARVSRMYYHRLGYVCLVLYNDSCNGYILN